MSKIELFNNWVLNPEITKKLLKKDSFVVYDKDWKKITIWWKEIKLSIFDIKDFSGFSDEDIITMLEYEFQLDLKNDLERSLRRLKRLFSESNKFYNKYTFDKVNLSKWKTFKVNSLKELISFIRWETWFHTHIASFVNKTAASIDDIIKTPHTRWLKQKDENFLNILGKIFPENNLWNDEDWRYIMFGNKKTYLYWTPKTSSSTIHKELNDPDYFSSTDIQDLLRYTLAVETNKDCDCFEVFWKLFNSIRALNWNIKSIKLKWFDSINLKKHLQTKWHEWEFDMLEKFIQDKKKKWTWESYREFKVTFELWWTNFEIKITTHKNDNQLWLNFHWVYAYFEKVICGLYMRHINWWNLFWYVTDQDLDIVVCDLWENMEKLVNDNKELKWADYKDIIKTIVQDLISKKILPWKFPSINKKELEKSFKDWMKKYYKWLLNEHTLSNWETVYISEKYTQLLKEWNYIKVEGKVEDNIMKIWQEEEITA